MSTVAWKGIVTAVLLGVSNFAFQCFPGHGDWAIAWERSWFQCVAIFAYFVSLKLAKILELRRCTDG